MYLNTSESTLISALNQKGMKKYIKSTLTIELNHLEKEQKSQFYFING